MRELDMLLSRYLDRDYEDAEDREKAAFRTLLSLPDPELVGYLLQAQRPLSEPIAHVVDRILGRTPA